MQIRISVLSVLITSGSFASESTHPHPQMMVRCERQDTSSGYVSAAMFYQNVDQERMVAHFSSVDPMEKCEYARRHSSGTVLCLTQNYRIVSYDLEKNKSIEEFGSESTMDSLKKCVQKIAPPPTETREGFVRFIPQDYLQTFLQQLPPVSDPLVAQVLKNPDTIWYDEKTMAFSYQDSMDNPQGMRSNRVGFDVGNNNRSNADIVKLLQYFSPTGFKFPFGTAAGTDQVRNKYMLDFWLPPRKDGKVIPVRYWAEETRWRWVFPVGTLFGEVLFLQAPDDQKWYVFEIRTRLRTQDGWATNVFRPFVTARSLAEAIQAIKPDWEKQSDLREFISHLQNPNTLQAASVSSGHFAALLPALAGSLDVLPEIKDLSMIKSFLTTRTFVSAEGTIWKENGTMQTYAPSTSAEFSIVPKNYTAGLIEVNDLSCSRCHQDAGRAMGDLDDRISAYGEIWGEDQIFTWHLFDVVQFSTSDDVRRASPRMYQAGLIAPGRPKENEQDYREVSRRYQLFKK